MAKSKMAKKRKTRSNPCGVKVRASVKCLYVEVTNLKECAGVYLHGREIDRLKHQLSEEIERLKEHK